MASTPDILGTMLNGANQVGSSGGVDFTAQQQAAAQARAANGGLDPIAGAAPAALGAGVPGQAVAAGQGIAGIGGASNDFVATTVPPALGATVAPSGQAFVPNPTTPGWMIVQNTHTGGGGGVGQGASDGGGGFGDGSGNGSDGGSGSGDSGGGD